MENVPQVDRKMASNVFQGAYPQIGVGSLPYFSTNHHSCRKRFWAIWMANGGENCLTFGYNPSISNRNLQFLEGDFSEGRGLNVFPEVLKMSTLKRMLDFNQK